MKRLLLLTILALATACSAGQMQTDPHLGKQLDLHVQDLATGKAVDPATWRGRVVLVDLWASWCESCKEAMPHHARLWHDLRSRGFEVVAISVDEDVAAAQQFLRERPLPFTVLWDAGQRTVTELAPPAMPTAYVLDRTGTVVAVAIGGTSEALRTIDAAVAAALDATPAAR